LATPSFAATARELAANFTGVDGATNAAEEIEQLLAEARGQDLETDAEVR
jgi:hypothetical protein